MISWFKSSGGAKILIVSIAILLTLGILGAFSERAAASMPKFRKKPVEIEAMCYLGGFSFDEMLVEWGEDFAKVASHNSLNNEMHIHTLEGIMKVNQGDFVIKGVANEFYPCKPDIFEQTYEPV